MTSRRRIAFGFAVAMIVPLTADADLAAYVLPAQCAAFWLGRDDFARVSAYLDRNAYDLPLAQEFRDVAVQLNGGAAKLVDAFIAQERPAMAQLIEAAILGDRQSTDLHERLVLRCGVAPKP